MRRERCCVDDPSRSSRWQSLRCSAGSVFSVSAAPPTGTDASEVTHWNEVAANTLSAFPGPAGGAPPAFQINMGMVQGAVYDAVNGIGPKTASALSARDSHGCQGIDRRCRRDGGVRRARRTSSRPHPGSRRSRVGRTPGTLTAQYDASLDAIDDNAFKMQGIKIGHAAAKAMLDSRVGDGRFGPSQWDAEHRPQDTGRRSSSTGRRPRSDSVGGRHEAVPHPELVAVPQRGAARR